MKKLISIVVLSLILVIPITSIIHLQLAAESYRSANILTKTDPEKISDLHLILDIYDSISDISKYQYTAQAHIAALELFGCMADNNWNDAVSWGKSFDNYKALAQQQAPNNKSVKNEMQMLEDQLNHALDQKRQNLLKNFSQKSYGDNRKVDW